MLMLPRIDLARSLRVVFCLSFFCILSAPGANAQSERYSREDLGRIIFEQITRYENALNGPCIGRTGRVNLRNTALSLGSASEAMKKRWGAIEAGRVEAVLADCDNRKYDFLVLAFEEDDKFQPFLIAPGVSEVSFTLFLDVKRTFAAATLVEAKKIPNCEAPGSNQAIIRDRTVKTFKKKQGKIEKWVEEWELYFCEVSKVVEITFSDLPNGNTGFNVSVKK